MYRIWRTRNTIELPKTAVVNRFRMVFFVEDNFADQVEIRFEIQVNICLTD